MTEQKKKMYTIIIDEYGVVDSGTIPAMLCTGGTYLIIDELVEEVSNRCVVNTSAPDGISMSEQEKWQKLKQQKEFRRMCKRGR